MCEESELAKKELALAESVDKDLAEHLIGDALENIVSAFDGFGREVCESRGRSEQQTIKRLEDIPQEVIEEAIRRGEERLRQLEAEKLAKDPTDT